MAYISPATNYGKRDPYGAMRPSDAPRATGGKRQPVGKQTQKLAKPKKITVKTHTRTVAPPASTKPVDPNAALLNAATRLRFGPQEQAYGQQLQQNARFSSGVNDWYANAMKEIQGLKAQGQAQGAQTLGAIQNYNSTPTVNTPEDAQAAAARNSLNSQYGAMVGRDQNANAAAMDRITAAYGAQQGNTQNAANAERGRLLAGLTALKGQEGDFKLEYGAQQDAAAAKSQTDAANLAIKQGTLNYLTGNAQATQGKTAVETAKTAADLKYFTEHGYYPSTGKPKGPSATEQINEAKLAFFNKHGYWPPTGPPKPTKGGKGDGGNSTYSKSKIQGFRSNWDYAKATAKQLKDKGTYTDKKGKVQNISTDVAYSALLNSVKDPDIAKAAAYWAFGKPLPADLRHRLAIKGVHPPEPKTPRAVGGGPYGTGHMEN